MRRKLKFPENIFFFLFFFFLISCPSLFVQFIKIIEPLLFMTCVRRRIVTILIYRKKYAVILCDWHLLREFNAVAILRFVSEDWF